MTINRRVIGTIVEEGIVVLRQQIPTITIVHFTIQRVGGNVHPYQLLNSHRQYAIYPFHG